MLACPSGCFEFIFVHCRSFEDMKYVYVHVFSSLLPVSQPGFLEASPSSLSSLARETSGFYIWGIPFFLGGGGLSADVVWGKICEKWNDQKEGRSA
jgi:hypothetical protein